jgi:hypothetical protein
LPCLAATEAPLQAEVVTKPRRHGQPASDKLGGKALHGIEQHATSRHQQGRIDSSRPQGMHLSTGGADEQQQFAQLRSRL